MFVILLSSLCVAVSVAAALQLSLLLLSPSFDLQSSAVSFAVFLCMRGVSWCLLMYGSISASFDLSLLLLCLSSVSPRRCFVSAVCCCLLLAS